MPLATRIVTPQRLNRQPVGKENQFDLGIFCNGSLVSTLKQLSNLAEHADGIFSELTEELVVAVKRADNLKKKVDTLGANVSKLNAKAVKVPEGDLDTYATISKHYHGDNGYQGSIFTTENRPECVKVLYEKAEENPVRIIRQCNANRTDGRTGSRLFTLTPIFQDGTYTEPEADLEIKPTSTEQSEQVSQDVPHIKSRPKSLPAFSELETTEHNSPEEPGSPLVNNRGMSKSQPAAMVPIDITGTGFNRMCEYRESIRSSSREYVRDGTLKRKKRRQTVSGAPGLVFNEISTSLFNMNNTASGVNVRTRSMSHERPKSAALDYYAPKKEHSSERRRIRERERRKEKRDPDESNLSRSCSLRRSLRSLFKDKRSKSTDLWAEGRPRSPGPPVVDLKCPMKRSTSLPRSLKSVMRTPSYVSDFDRERSASTEGRLDASAEQRAPHQAKTSSSSGKRENKPKTRPPRSVSHNANLHGSTFVDHLTRPKSMDIGPYATSVTNHHSITVSSPTTPSTESITSSTTQDSHVSNSKHIHVNIPDKPWTKPFAKVKLRFNRKLKAEKKEDRQSSSGHWSASSSSARYSLDSDFRRSASSPERLSLCDKDSAVSLNIHGPERINGRISEEASTYNGEGDSSTLNGSSSGNESIVDVKNNFTKMSTDEWLKQVKMKKGKGITKSGTLRSTVSDDSNGSGSVKSLRGLRLTTKNLIAHDHEHEPLGKGMSRVGDDESSIYSIDQEGFYTSMHKDCGVMKHVDKLLEEDEDNMTSSTVSEGVTVADKPKDGHSNISKKFSSFLSKKGTMKRKDNTKRIPPPPPPRVSTISDKGNLSQTSEEGSPGTSELQKLAQLAQQIAQRKDHEAKLLNRKLQRSLSFDSDVESLRARVQLKSNISPSAIPSLCSVTPIPTDDEDMDMLGYSSAWKPHVNNDAVAYKEYMGTLKSCRSAPGTLDDSTLTETSFSSTTLDLSSIQGDGENVKDMSPGQYSTWPRSPSNKHSAASKASSQLKPPQCLTIKPPNLSLFYSDEKFSFVDARHALPEAKTPDSILDGRGLGSPTNNTFKAPQESSTPLKGEEQVALSFDSPSINSFLSAQKSIDSGQSSERSADWTSTWPRRKAVTFISSAEAVSKDDSSISTSTTQKPGIMRKSSTNTFPRKGDRAHFISPKSREVKAPDSLPLMDLFSPQAAHAKLVISSPVANRACFVENPCKRSVCSPVTADDILKLWNYNSADKWYNTLPRKTKPEMKQSFSFPTGDILQDKKTQDDTDVDPVINKVPKSVTMFDFATESVLEEDPSSTKRPPSRPLYPSIRSMKHSMNFPGAPKRNVNSTNYGRTWYDGIDAPSTVVVMSPDGSQTMKETRTSFAAFLRDQHSGSSLGVPVTMRHRRDSATSSISTNSSSSGRKSVTFASVHQASSSNLSRTSLDATSITSSQISADVPSDGKSVQSLPSDDGIQMTPQKKDAPADIVSCLKRSSSSGSGELRIQPPLETIIGSDSETGHNLSEDRSFDEGVVCTCQPTVMSTFAKPPAQAPEPSAKRQKVNSLPRQNSGNHKLRSSPPRGKSKQQLITTSFVGPSIKLDSGEDNLFIESGNELKPMPLISTSFVGAFKMENPKEQTTILGKPRTLFANKTDTKSSAATSGTIAKTVKSATSGKADKVVVSVAHSRPVGPPPPPPQGNGKTEKTPTQTKYMPTKFTQDKQKEKSPSPSAQSNIVIVSTSQNGSLPRQNSANKLSSFCPENKTSAEAGTKSCSVASTTSSTSSSSSSVHKSSSSSSLPSSSTSTVASALTNKPQSSAYSFSFTSKASPTSSTTSSSKTTTIAATSPSSSKTTTIAATSPSNSVTSRAMPAAPKFLLPKLRPWNPPSLSNSRTSTLLSRLSATATQGTIADSKSGASNGAQPKVAPANGASDGKDKKTTPSGVDIAVGAGGCRDKSVLKDNQTPEGVLPASAECDSTRQTEVSVPSNSNNDKEKSSVAKCESVKSQSVKSQSSSPEIKCNRSSSLNQSLTDLSAPNLRKRDPNREEMNRSTSCLNRWSTADLGSSALSLARSTSTLIGLSFSSNNLNKSSLSLAASNDSLASNSSTAEKSRIAKLAFLSTGDKHRNGKANGDRFSKYSLGHKKLSASRGSLASLSERPENTTNHKNTTDNNNLVKTRSFSGSSGSSTHNSSRRNSSTGSRSSLEQSPKSSPVQGKFVSSILGKLHKKGLNTSMTRISQTASSPK